METHGKKNIGFPLGSLSLDKKVLEHPSQIAIQTENPNSRKSSVESIPERRRKSLNDIETPQKDENRKMTREEQREHTRRLRQGLSPKRNKGRKPKPLGFYRE